MQPYRPFVVWCNHQCRNSTYILQQLLAVYGSLVPVWDESYIVIVSHLLCFVVLCNTVEVTLQIHHTRYIMVSSVHC